MWELELSRESSTKLYIQVYKKLKQAILKNELLPNKKLPTVRELARVLCVNPATIVKAYDLLANEQLIKKRQGSGCFVRAPLFEMENGAPVADFASADPTTPPSFVKEFQEILNQVLNRDQGAAFSYQKGQGFLPLRESLCALLEKDRIHADPSRIQVVSGAQQAIDLIAKVFLDFEDRVLVEEPTYPGALQAFRSRGAHIYSHPLRGEGFSSEELLARIPKVRPRLVYVMPNFQNPTGISWGLEQRLLLLKLSTQYDFYIVEDDCLGELDYEGTLPRTIQSEDTHNRVLYIKSFSKFCMPGLRLAFLLLPETYVRAIGEAKQASDIAGFSLVQRAFDLYLRQGLFHSHLKTTKAIFHERFSLVKESLSLLPPSLRVHAVPKGGLYFWFHLTKGQDSRILAEKTLEQGVSIGPGHLFSQSERSSCFRISIASVRKEQMQAGLQVLFSSCESLPKP